MEVSLTRNLIALLLPRKRASYYVEVVQFWQYGCTCSGPVSDLPWKWVTNGSKNSMISSIGKSPPPSFRRHRETLLPNRPCKAQVSTVESAISYVKQLHLLQEGDTVDACELSSGSINYVYRLSDSSRSLLLKYCPPYVKSLGEGTFPLTQERLAVEAAALQLLQATCPQHIPRLLHYDARRCVLIQEYLHSHEQLSAAIHEQGLIFPQMASQLADFVSRSLYLNSRYNIDETRISEMTRQFCNAEVVAANERVVLTDAFDRTCPANRCPPELAEMVEELRSDPQVLAAHAHLLQVYRTRKEALIHNDLHLGNILVGVEQLPSGLPAPERMIATERMGEAAACEAHMGTIDSLPAAEVPAPAPLRSLYVIDYEFATVGPMAYDVGSLLGNLLLAFLTVRAGSWSQDPASSRPRLPSRLQQQRWLLTSIHVFWAQLSANMELYKAGGTGQGLHAVAGSNEDAPRRQGQGVLDVDQLQREAVGFAALCMVRLTVGMHHYPGHASLSQQQRVRCGAWTLQLARELLCRSNQQRSRLDAAGLIQLLEASVAN